MLVPADLLYSEDHQWVRVETASDGSSRLRIGLTHYAQDALGEVTLVALRAPGTDLDAGDEMGEVEALKAISDVYMPVSATVVDHNPLLASAPTSVNSDPYGAGWLCTAVPAEPTAKGLAKGLQALLTPDAYLALIGDTADV